MIKKSLLLKELEHVFFINDEFSVNALLAIENLSKVSAIMKPVSTMEEDATVEIDVDELKNISTLCELSERILIDTLSFNFREEEVEDMIKDNHIELKLDYIKKKTSSLKKSVLVQYNKFLLRHTHLIDDALIDFLDYIEKEDYDNAGFFYSDLNQSQKKSIPQDILNIIS